MVSARSSLSSLSSIRLSIDQREDGDGFIFTSSSSASSAGSGITLPDAAIDSALEAHSQRVAEDVKVEDESGFDLSNSSAASIIDDEEEEEEDANESAPN